MTLTKKYIFVYEKILENNPQKSQFVTKTLVSFSLNDIHKSSITWQKNGQTSSRN